MATIDDENQRDDLPDPTQEELATSSTFFNAHPLEFWRERQAGLRLLGFNPGPIDGISGPKTHAAVRAFQTSVGLKVDGIWGPATQAAFDARVPASIEVWRERQTGLKSLGFNPGPIDGLLGPKTITAIRAFQASAGIKVDGIWGPVTQAAFDARMPAPPTGYQDYLGAVVLSDDFWSSFVDLSKNSNVADDNGLLRRKGTRTWSALKRIVWHQTSFTWNPYRESAAANKWSGHHRINAHLCLDTDGTIILIHPLASYLWTANAFNPNCLSCEIMGNFEGVLGSGSWYQPEKFGRARPKRIQLLRARQMTKWLLDPTQGPADGNLPPLLLEWRKACAQLGAPPITWVNPHRGATDDRGNDCGSECWYHIGEHTIANYSQVVEGPLAGKGQPTPNSWREIPRVPPLEG